MEMILKTKTNPAYLINAGILWLGASTSIHAAVMINEIDYDQPSTDFAEFVEIKNAGTGSADLSEYTLELVNGNGGAVYQNYPLPGCF